MGRAAEAQDAGTINTLESSSSDQTAEIAVLQAAEEAASDLTPGMDDGSAD